jgi:hypothetical protein
MLLGSAEGIVVKMIDYEGIAVGREVDVEFKEEWNDSGRRGVRGGESQENIALSIDEFKE